MSGAQDQLTRADVQRAEVTVVPELASDATAAILAALSVVSTTSGTKVVVVGTPADGEGILNGRDHPIQAGDIAIITGTSGGLGNGTFTVATVTDDTHFTVVESIGTSTGGFVTFLYKSGGKMVGFDPTKQAESISNTAQGSTTDALNAHLLDNEPTGVANTYSNTITGGKVTQEKWVRTAGSVQLKTIDYTYTGTRVTTEVRKVYAADGTTVLAQMTLSYTYTGSTLTGETVTRDV